MKAPRLAIALLAVSTALLPLASAGATSVSPATELTLPTPNSGLDQGYLPFQSCSSIGNCALSGIYLAKHNFAAGVIESEVKGVWQNPFAMTPPNGYIAAHGVAVEGLSCPATGSCVALGRYETSTNQLPFVVSETKGIWQRSVALALPKNAVNTGELATPHEVTCFSTGNCTVVGTYTTNRTGFATQGFIVSEVRGVWRSASELTLPPGANSDPSVSLTQVSCWSAGNCVAVGSYIDANNVSHDIMVPEIAGSWKSAESVGLPGNASAFAGAQFNEVACTSSGACLAAGTYNTITGAVQPIVALGSVGSWNRALEVNLPLGAPNPEALLFGFNGASCSTPGNCAVVGQYVDNTGRHQGFLDNVVNGNVQRAQVLRLPAGAVQAGPNGGVVSVSCPGVGTCVAGAAYLSAQNKYQAIVTSESNNVWSLGSTVSLPASATTVGVAGGIYSVQCFTTSSCVVSGSFQSTGARYDGFTLTTSA
jgi:hypothetical protein